jgi:hypothetical protein
MSQPWQQRQYVLCYRHTITYLKTVEFLVNGKARYSYLLAPRCLVLLLCINETFLLIFWAKRANLELRSIVLSFTVELVFHVSADWGFLWWICKKRNLCLFRIFIKFETFLRHHAFQACTRFLREKQNGMLTKILFIHKKNLIHVWISQEWTRQIINYHCLLLHSTNILHFLNNQGPTVFTTLHFLRNLWMGPIS